MHITPQGWLHPATHTPSPNHDPRPPGVVPELIVIHAISLPPGQFGGPWIDQLFTNALDPAEHPYFEQIHTLRVSAHLLVRRDGSLVQYVPFGERAWHAGVSRFAGRERCNDFSIGIELEGADDSLFAAVQYERASQVIGVLEQAYESLRGRPVVGHSDIAPGRKTDPGPCFDWQRFEACLGRPCRRG